MLICKLLKGNPDNTAPPVSRILLVTCTAGLPNLLEGFLLQLPRICDLINAEKWELGYTIKIESDKITDQLKSSMLNFKIWHNFLGMVTTIFCMFARYYCKCHIVLVEYGISLESTPHISFSIFSLLKVVLFHNGLMVNECHCHQRRYSSRVITNFRLHKTLPCTLVILNSQYQILCTLQFLHGSHTLLTWFMFC